MRRPSAQRTRSHRIPALALGLCLLATGGVAASKEAGLSATASKEAGLSARASKEARLSKDERRLVAAIDARDPAARDLLKRAVDINSGSNNLEGVRAVGDLFRKEFDALGFETSWVDGAGWGRAGHLIARRMGRDGSPRVLLIGHLDTVFPKDSPFQRFEPIPGGDQARGPGLLDMKGGDVIMLLALGGLHDARLLDRLSIVAVLTGDEEDSGRPLEAARRDLVEAARWADVAIGFEDGDGDPRTGVIARRGSGTWLLKVTGKQAHSSQVWSEAVGSGAIYEAARILAGFEAALQGENLLTVNPGTILGGTAVTFDNDESRGTAFGKSNVVAKEATVAGDLRCITLEQRERARARMREVLATPRPATSATIEFDDGYPPLAPSDGNRRLLALYDQASRDLGLGAVTAVDPRNAGAADVSFTEGLVGMALDGIGMRGRDGHTVNETADLGSLRTQARRAAVLLARVDRGQAAAPPTGKPASGAASGTPLASDPIKP